MAAAMSLTFDPSRWSAALDKLGGKGLQAVARGLNRTITSERTAMARAVSQDMGITVARARDAIKVGRATRANPSATLTTRGKKLPLIDFKARGRYPSRGSGGGVTYVVKGQRRRIANAFIAIVTRAGENDQHAGHRGVFVRVGKKRLPIKQRYGASIAHAFGNLLPAGEAKRNAALEKNIAHEIQFEVSRLKA